MINKLDKIYASCYQMKIRYDSIADTNDLTEEIISITNAQALRMSKSNSNKGIRLLLNQ